MHMCPLQTTQENVTATKQQSHMLKGSAQAQVPNHLAHHKLSGI